MPPTGCHFVEMCYTPRTETTPTRRWPMTRPARLAPAAALALVSLLPVFPYLIAGGLPLTADGMLHLHRALLWRWAWDEGVWWPRWHTLLARGLGYPIFTFTPPFLYAAVAGLQAFLSPVAALKFFLALASWAYALGMYAWAREHLPPGAALAAAVAYTLAPYRFRELFVQGNYQQFWAWALFPWITLAWGCLVLAEEPGRRVLVAAAFSYGLLILSHHVSTLLFTPFLALYVAWLLVTAVPRRRRWAAFRRAGQAFVLAVGLGALYWGPALAERALVALDVARQGFFDPTLHLISVREMLAATPLQDTRAYNPKLPFNVGRAHLVLAAVGGLTLVKVPVARWRRDVRALAVVLWLAALFMMVPASAPLWEALPPLAYAQFPTRFYGPAFLFSSLLVGFGVVGLADLLGRLRPSAPHRRAPAEAIAAGLAVLLLAGAAMPYFFQWRFAPAETTPAAVVRYERRTGTWGTTAAGEFLPVPPEVAAGLPAGVDDALERRAFVEPPPALEGEVEGWGAHWIALRYRAGGETWATLPQFAFPGWRALVDGRPVPVARDPATGLLRVRLPAGQHRLEVRMGNTPVRAISGLVALASAAWLLLGGAWPAGRRKARRPAGAARHPSVPRVGPWQALPWLAVGLVLLLRVAWGDLLSRRFVVTSPPDRALPATYSAFMPLGAEAPVALIGYDLSATRVVQGGTLDVRLYWQPLARLEADYAAFVQLVAGPQGRAFAGSDTLPPGDVPTRAWDPALYIIDDHRLRVPESAPAVRYRLVAGLYDPLTLERAGTVELPTTVRVRPRRPVRPEGRDVGVLFGDNGDLELVSARLERDGGGRARLTLFWRARARPRRNYQLFIHLVDADGAIIAQADAPPVNGLFPFSQWEPGDLLADVHELPLPPNASPQAVKVGLYELETLRRLPARDPNGRRLDEDAVVIPFGSPR